MNNWVAAATKTVISELEMPFLRERPKKPNNRRPGEVFTTSTMRTKASSFY